MRSARWASSTPFQELYPAIEAVGLREGHDDEGQNYRQTATSLAQHPDLAGIYTSAAAPRASAGP